jgi:hypothetical protein
MRRSQTEREADCLREGDECFAMADLTHNESQGIMLRHIAETWLTCRKHSEGPAYPSLKPWQDGTFTR